MRFFDPFAEIRVTRHNLPHWQQPGAAYFITFRMADSLPDDMLRGLDLERRRWQEAHPPPLSTEDDAEFHRLFSAQVGDKKRLIRSDSSTRSGTCQVPAWVVWKSSLKPKPQTGLGKSGSLSWQVLLLVLGKRLSLG